KPLLYSKMIAATTTVRNVNIAAVRSGLRILQRHFKDDVSCIPAAVDDLFDQCEQIAQKNHLLRFVIALIKIAQQIELEFVSLALNRLELCIHLARGRRVRAFA